MPIRHTIVDFVRDPPLALVDAVSMPEFLKFIDPSDIETITLTSGGVPTQARALSASAIRKVIDRVIAAGKKNRADLNHWICSKEEFGLCSKLDMPPGQLMRALSDFLNGKAGRGGMAAVGLVALCCAPPLGVALAIFTAIAL